MKTFQIILFIIISFSAQHQKLPEYLIEIDGYASINNLKMKIRIEYLSEEIKVVYKKRTGYVPDSDENNSERIHLLKKYEKAKTKIRKEKILKKMMELNIKNELYKTDSLALKIREHEQYANTIETFLNTKEEIILKNFASEKYILLDGTSFNIRITEKGKLTKNFKVQAPRSDSYPLINQLICESLDLYRAKFEDSFLDKKHTNGY